MAVRRDRGRVRLTSVVCTLASASFTLRLLNLTGGWGATGLALTALATALALGLVTVRARSGAERVLRAMAIVLLVPGILLPEAWIVLAGLAMPVYMIAGSVAVIRGYGRATNGRGR